MPQMMNTDDAEPSNSQQEDRKPDDPARDNRADSEQTGQNNVGDNGDDNTEMVYKDTATTDYNQEPLENEVQQLQDSAVVYC